MPKVARIELTEVELLEPGDEEAGLYFDCYDCEFEDSEDHDNVLVPVECPVDKGDYLWTKGNLVYWTSKNLQPGANDVVYMLADCGWNADGTETPRRKLFKWGKEKAERKAKECT